MNFVIQLYPLVAAGETGAVANLLGAATYTPEIVEQVIPFGEGLTAVSQVVSDRFLLDLQAANEAKENFYQLLAGETPREQLKKVTGLLRDSCQHPGIFRRSKEEILKAVRAALKVSPARAAEILRAIDKRSLHYGPHRLEEIEMLDIHQIDSLIDILREEIEPIKEKAERIGIAHLRMDEKLPLQNARNLARTLANRAYELVESVHEGKARFVSNETVAVLAAKFEALRTLEEWLDENAYKE